MPTHAKTEPLLNDCPRGIDLNNKRPHNAYAFLYFLKLHARIFLFKRKKELSPVFAFIQIHLRQGKS